MTEDVKMKESVHSVLAHSYAFYFILFLLGLLFHFLFPVKISSGNFIAPIGFLFLLLSTLLIFWAQGTSRKLDKSNISKEAFCRGPYCYTRTPTHFGLFFLMIGFGLLMNSVFIIFSTLISFIVSKSTFLKKQETILAQKYGVHYTEYKKLVKF